MILGLVSGLVSWASSSQAPVTPEISLVTSSSIVNPQPESWLAVLAVDKFLDLKLEKFPTSLLLTVTGRRGGRPAEL